ncbi:MAG: 5-methylthioadenosine/S-adenosylhomocysteine deaminase [Thermoplasmata archaeon]|nr:5-methylthioadenosine/S-adenosylhomocysteine deaminase [Thermoplasmata archaeon]
MPSLLVRDAIILTQDARRTALRGDLLAREGMIEAIGPGLRADADVTVEAGGDILLPGFVNAHTHSPMTLFRGLGDDLPLEEWLRTRIWPAERRLTQDDIITGTQLALLEMIRTGTTCFNDMYFFSDATAQAAAAAGIRAHVGATLIGFDTPELKVHEQEPNARRHHAKWKDHALITPTLSPHATYTMSDDALERCRAVRDETGMRIHTHCSETRFEVQDVLSKKGARPVEVLRRHDLLRGSVLAHCGWVTKDEIRVMAEHGASAAHCPISNLKLATGGVMPMEEMREAGVTVALGTDGAASNNSLDMLETTKFAAILQKNHRWDARAAPAQVVLDQATIGGSRALGLDARGLVVGAPADLCLVSTKAPHMRPLHDPASALVYCAHGGDVRMTAVAGKPLYLDGRFLTLDEQAVVAKTDRAAERLGRAVANGLGPVR